MAMTQKKVFVTASIIFALIGIVLGAVLLLLAAIIKPDSVDNIVRGVLIISGIITVIGNVPGLVSGISRLHTPAGMSELITSALGIAFGVALIVYQGRVLVTIVGVYLIVYPLLLVLLSKNKKAAFKTAWPRMLLGVILLAMLPMVMWTVFETVHILLTILGWLVIGLSILLGVIGVIRSLRMAAGKNRPIVRTEKGGSGKKLYVDQTGDGVVDVIINDEEQ